MAKKKYDTDNLVTMASEPSVAYIGSLPASQSVRREKKRDASSDVLPGCVSFEEFKEALMKSVDSYSG